MTRRRDPREERTPEHAREGKKGAAASHERPCGLAGGRATTACDGRQHVPWRASVQRFHGVCRCVRCDSAGGEERRGKCLSVGFSAKTRERCYLSMGSQKKGVATADRTRDLQISEIVTTEETYGSSVWRSPN